MSLFCFPVANWTSFVKNTKMFEDKNKRNSLIDLSQNKELKPDDIPVHTMLKDLEELEHPEKNAPLLPKKKFFSPAKDNLSDLQKTSPFLTENKESQPIKIDASRLKISESIKPPEVPVPKVSFPETKKDLFISPKPEKFATAKKETDTGRSIGKLIAAIVIVLALIGMGVGGYYFWTTRQSVPAIVVTPEPQPEPVSKPEPVPVSKFTLDKPNLLQIDIGASSPSAITEALSGYIEDIKKETISTPVEFAIVDKENNPVPLSVFSKKFGIVFSKNISAVLKDSFSLFIFNDNGNYRLGLSIDYKAGVDLKKLMLAEEPRLPAELKPLFLDIRYEPMKNMRFSDNVYGDLPVRYENIVSPEYLSLDYAITDKTLFIATTKMTARAIIDYSKAQTAKEEVPKSPQQPEQDVDNSLKTPLK